MSEFKVGLLLPRSSLYPMIGTDIVNGLKAGLKEFGLNHVKIIYENIGFGAEEGDVYGKAEKLLLQEEVSIVVAFMDHSAATVLDPLFEGNNRILLVLDPGGHTATEPSTSFCRFTISLHGAICCRKTGTMAASEGVARSVFATSFYEAGYLGCFSYQRGLELAGGAVHYHSVIPFRLEQFQIETLKYAMTQINPDAVLALFSAEAGGLFLKEYSNAGLHRQARVYASPFMMEEQWLSTVPFPFEGISGCVCWTRKLPHDMNTIFNRSFEDLYGKKTNVFSLLGWEAAQFIYEGFDVLSSVNGNVRKAGEQLNAISFISPRGKLQVHAPSRYLTSPMYRVGIVKDEETGNSELELQGEVPFEVQELEHYLSDGPQGVFSKWTNTYLCI